MKKTDRKFGGKFKVIKKQDDLVKYYDSESGDYTTWITTIPEEVEVYIKEVMYAEPATIVFWSDGTKTVSKCHGADVYSPEAGLAICCLKKLVGATNVKMLINDWTPISYGLDWDGSIKTKVTLKDVRAKIKKE